MDFSAFHTIQKTMAVDVDAHGVASEWDCGDVGDADALIHVRTERLHNKMWHRPGPRRPM